MGREILNGKDINSLETLDLVANYKELFNKYVIVF